jgi:hypothetical protein
MIERHTERFDHKEAEQFFAHNIATTSKRTPSRDGLFLTGPKQGKDAGGTSFELPPRLLNLGKRLHELEVDRVELITATNKVLSHNLLALLQAYKEGGGGRRGRRRRGCRLLAFLLRWVFVCGSRGRRLRGDAGGGGGTARAHELVDLGDP